MIIVDAHVHIHKCCDLELLLNAAYENFSRHARKAGHTGHFLGVLMLSEIAGVNEFEKLVYLSDFTEKNAMGCWRLKHCEESCSIVISRHNVEQMVIVSGRQIVTAEKLEVLALGTRQEFMDGIPVSSLLKSVQETGAIPVIPWGVGKWLGARGNILSQVLGSNAKHGLCLGDNGGRPVFWRNPSHFKQAREAKIPILPGSDPLPLPREVSRIGSFGFTLQASISTSHPARDIRRLLIDPGVEIIPYGRLQGPLRFLQNQLSIRIARPSQNTEAL